MTPGVGPTPGPDLRPRLPIPGADVSSQSRLLAGGLAELGRVELIFTDAAGLARSLPARRTDLPGLIGRAMAPPAESPAATGHTNPPAGPAEPTLHDPGLNLTIFITPAGLVWTAVDARAAALFQAALTHAARVMPPPRPPPPPAAKATGGDS